MQEQPTPRLRRGASFSYTVLKHSPKSPRAGSHPRGMNRPTQDEKRQNIQRVLTLAESVAAALRPSYGLVFRELAE